MCFKCEINTRGGFLLCKCILIIYTCVLVVFIHNKINYICDKNLFDYDICFELLCIIIVVFCVENVIKNEIWENNYM